MDSALAWLQSHPAFSGESSQELNRYASLAQRHRNEQSNNFLLLPRRNDSASIEVELETRVHNAAVPIETAASASIQEASNVKKTRLKPSRKQNQPSEASEAPDRFIADSADDDTLNSSAVDANSPRALNNPRTDQPRGKVAGDETTRTLQSLANRREGYQCGCGLSKGHPGICQFNTTEEARQEVLERKVVQPMPSAPDVQKLMELKAGGKAAHQEQYGRRHSCGRCGEQDPSRPHKCPLTKCPVCGRRRKEHFNDTLCPKPKKRKKKDEDKGM
jgi:hypothetical protein